MFKLNFRAFWRPEAAKAKLREQASANIRTLAEYVAFKARAYAPVDTGELRNSIKIIADADGMTFHVVATARHSEPVEFGHVTRSGSFVPPVRFLRRALEDGARRWPQLVNDSRVRQGYHRGEHVGVRFQA